MSHKRAKRQRRWLGFRARAEKHIPDAPRAERRRALAAAIARYTLSPKHRPRRVLWGPVASLLKKTEEVVS